MTFMLILGLGLFFFSIAYFAYEGIPRLMGKYSTMQQKRMEDTAKNLNRFLVMKEGKKMTLIYSTAPLLGGALGFFLMKNIFGIIAGGGVGFLIPKIIVRQMATMRKNKFQDQLVDGLMVLSSALKSGMSLNQAIEILVEELPPPLCEEFSLLLRENHMGVPLEECFLHLRERVPLDDLGLIISAIGVARETGGDLTDIFSQLVFTIREKNKLERKVRTLTVQGRLQGLIMSLLPIAFALFMKYTSPENFNILLENKMGQMLLIYAVCSEIVGVILIRKLSKVEV